MQGPARGRGIRLRGGSMCRPFHVWYHLGLVRRQRCGEVYLSGVEYRQMRERVRPSGIGTEVTRKARGN
jgi:hypothetical protein